MLAGLEKIKTNHIVNNSPDIMEINLSLLTSL